jgi:hypothetical protein
MLAMQHYHSKFLALGLTLGTLCWLATGCQQKPSVPSPLSNTPQPQPTASAMAPSPTASVTVGTDPQSNPGMADGNTPGSSPTPATETSLPPLSREDQAIAQKMQQEVQEKVGRLSIQPVGKTYLSSLLLEQKAEKLVKNKFSSDLQQLDPDLQSETNEYQLQIVAADANQSIITATAKAPGLPSYTGAVFAVKEKLSVTGICKTKIPSQIPPTPPTLMGETVKCGSDSVSDQ